MTSGGSTDSYKLTVGDSGEEKILTTGGGSGGDELVVMAGEQSRSRRWKPVRHSVEGGGGDRGWYGAMYFEKGTIGERERGANGDDDDVARTEPR